MRCWQFTPRADIEPPFLVMVPSQITEAWRAYWHIAERYPWIKPIGGQCRPVKLAYRLHTIDAHCRLGAVLVHPQGRDLDAIIADVRRSQRVTVTRAEVITQ